MVSRTRPEIWGGVECTVNRVGDLYFDQLERNGHARRTEDLDLFASLGLRTLRYPILWERIAPDSLDRPDWSWADRRLERMRELGIRPIVGLLHHGSGPRYTSLIDPNFPEKLATFASAFAQRYPWVGLYTPINEPLTTARFSGLYGHWYPHGRDGSTFARALLAQCRATVLAMEAVRHVNPAAELVQTEDLGKVFSTPELDYQAEFENERRWLTYDLLCGRVDDDHPLRRYLRRFGVERATLDWFLQHTAPPDILGVNHYATSERFLDHRLEHYPVCLHGGNGRHSYVDVEAVRVLAAGPAGPRVLLREAWERYGIPIAITEVHLGGTREEQLRWLADIWEAAVDLRSDGVDIPAITAWSLLGTYDWNSLLTRSEGHYESGAFDVRGPSPRPTAVARMLRDLVEGKQPEHPVLSEEGWWRRDDRLIYPSFHSPKIATAHPSRSRQTRAERSPVLITGATGTLGRAFARLCKARAIDYRLMRRSEMDIADPDSVERALEHYRPWGIINTAGYVRVDDAESEQWRCHRENVHGPSILADACSRHDTALVTFSSDLVFDGNRRAPYLESDPVAPLNEYGRSKTEGERQVMERMPGALLIRTSAFFGPWDEHNFITIALRTLASGRRFVAADDAIVSPTYVPDLVHAALDLLIDGESGIWHLANAGATSWFDLARSAAELAGIDASGLEGCPSGELNLAAPRPLYSVLGSERGMILPPLENALVRYLRECEVSYRHSQAIDSEICEEVGGDEVAEEIQA
jgi:dTDP-4-dehydrorhamnose reductase